MKVPDERLNGLIAIYGFLVQKTLPLEGGDIEINKEYADVLESLKELQSLRKLKHGVEEAIKEIDKYLKATIKRQDKYTGDQPYLVSCIITGIRRTRGILKKHVSKYLEE